MLEIATSFSATHYPRSSEYENVFFPTFRNLAVPSSISSKMSDARDGNDTLPDDVLYCIFEHLKADPRPQTIANVDFRNIALSGSILLSHGRRLLYSTIAVHSGAGHNDLELMGTLQGKQLLVEGGSPLAEHIKVVNVYTWDASLSQQAFETLRDLWM